MIEICSVWPTTAQTIEPNSVGVAFLFGWIDFNANGTFDSGERFIPSPFQPINASGTVNLSVTIPADAVIGQTYARFRIGSISGAGSASGSDSYGEVEDYEVLIEEATPELLVTKSQTGAGNIVGEYITYDILVENTGKKVIEEKAGGVVDQVHVLIVLH